jgi:dipeptidyl-peptidase-4
VPTFVVTDEVPTDQRVEMTRYPQVGDPNPIARVGVVAAAGGPTTWIDMSAYDPTDALVVRVGWAPDSRRVMFQVQNRVQSWLELNGADVRTGKPTRLIREETAYWVDPIDSPMWLPDGTFLWQSDRTGYRHVYRYSSDGRLAGAVTSGDWDVRALYGAADGWVYFSAAEHSPLANHVYRAKMDGTGLVRLTDADADHTANFNPQFSMFVDVASNVTTPHKTRLRDATGRVVRVVEENAVPVLAEYRLGKVEFVKVPARDGVVLEGMMIKPPDFDPSKKYRVMSFTYAGPGAQSVRDAWGRQTYMWHQMLAQQGIIVWILDNRGASNKGVRSAHTSFRNFGEADLRDLLDGVAWLSKQPYVDANRIGIWGWSFGGYMTAYALTHSDAFKLGIAGAPVTDWRLYDSVYTERYMGLPGQNPQGYERSSVLAAAANLKGKLLLIHGAIDDNVHVQNSIVFADALQRAGKPFELMLYPQSRHGVTHPMRVKHMREMMTRFILENL